MVVSVCPADLGRIYTGLTSSFETGSGAFPVPGAQCVASHGLEVKSEGRVGKQQGGFITGSL